MKDKRAEKMKVLKDKGLSYQAIGKIFNITRQRVHQIITTAGKPRAGVWHNSLYYKRLKALIIKRDKQCQKCGSTENLLVHHIDKDRSNNNLTNLITLCNKCHGGLHSPSVEDIAGAATKRYNNFSHKEVERLKKGRIK